MKWHGNSLNEDCSKSEHIHHSSFNCFNFFSEQPEFIIEDTKTFKGRICILESIQNFKKTTPPHCFIMRNILKAFQKFCLYAEPQSVYFFMPKMRFGTGLVHTLAKSSPKSTLS